MASETLPTITMNGTSAAQLRESHAAICEAATALLREMRIHAPNARDYPNRFAEVCAERQAQYAAVDDIRKLHEAIAIHASDHE